MTNGSFHDYHSAISFRYGPTTSPILLDNLGCSSSNTHLRVCPHGGIGVHNCDHNQDVILSCRSEGSVQLMTTSSSSSTLISPFGRLEVYINGRWGTVCDNGFSNTSANVVCQQLGFSAAERWTNIGAQRCMHDWVLSRCYKFCYSQCVS